MRFKRKHLQSIFSKHDAYLMKHKVKLFALAFLIYFFAGLIIYPHYGVHTDESNNQALGKRWAGYIFTAVKTGDAPVVADDDNIGGIASHNVIHGPFLEVGLKFLEYGLLGYKADSRDVVLLRHLSIFLLFYASSIFFFLACFKIFRKYSYAFIATCMLVLHPRIFADSFYNTVDIGILSLFIISFYTMMMFLEKRNLRWALIHGLSCAAMIATRSFGVIMPVFTILIYAYVFYTRNDQRKSISPSAKIVGVFVAVTVMLTILFWPMLWHNTLHNFMNSLKATVYFHWGKNTTYAYNLVWISITTPIAFLALFLLGALTFAAQRTRLERDYLFLLISALLVILPIVGAIIARTSLYDGWRHHYFIYPFVVIIAISGLRWLIISVSELKISSRTKQIILLFVRLAVSLSLVVVLLDIVVYHPYEFVYRNEFGASYKPSSRDYWYVAQYHGLEHILSIDKRKSVSVYVPGYNNIKLLPTDDRKRLDMIYKYADNITIDYIIPQEWTHDLKFNHSNYIKIYSQSRYGIDVFSVYMRKDLNADPSK